MGHGSTVTTRVVPSSRQPPTTSAASRRARISACAVGSPSFSRSLWRWAMTSPSRSTTAPTGTSSCRTAVAPSSRARPMAASRSTGLELAEGVHAPVRQTGVVAIELNHTIVAARDARAAAHGFADLFGVAAPEHYGPFWQISTANGVGLDFADADGEITPQHYAFLVSEDDFDAIYGRVAERGSTTGPTRCSTAPARSTATTAAAASTSSATTAISSRSSPGPTAAARSRDRGAAYRAVMPAHPLEPDRAAMEAMAAAATGVVTAFVEGLPDAPPPGPRAPGRWSGRCWRRRRKGRATSPLLDRFRRRPPPRSRRPGPATWPTWAAAASTPRPWPSSWPGPSTATRAWPPSPPRWWPWRRAPCAGWPARWGRRAAAPASSPPAGRWPR